MTTLDPRALKASRAAYQSAIPDGAWHTDGGETDAPIRAAITAYLAAQSQPQAGEPVATGGWSYSINYGPEGEENWANLIAPDGSHVANIRTHYATAIVAGLSASPPLSGEVEALRKIEYALTKASLCDAEKISDALSLVRRALSVAPATADGWRTECATEGCDKPSAVHFIRGDVGSHYCHECYMRVQALPAAPTATGGR